MHTYQFTRGEIEAARLPSITQADAAKLYSVSACRVCWFGRWCCGRRVLLSPVVVVSQEYVVAGNGLSPAPKERRLSLELFAHGTTRAPPTGTASATAITDVDAFVASLQPFA